MELDFKNLTTKQLKIYIDIFALAAGIAAGHGNREKFVENNQKKEMLEKELWNRTHPEQKLC